MKKYRLLPQFWIILIWLAFLTSACQPFLNSPRLATATAQAQIVPTATAEPLVLPAPTATAVSITLVEIPPATSPNPSLTVWINETSPAHEQALQQMMDEFSQTENIDVELVLVSPALLPKLMETAVLSDTLPDVVLHPIAYTAGWAKRRILDTAVTDEILNQIGRDTFNPAALELVTVDGLVTAIPSDGYQQILVYRADWFEEQELPPPDNYDAILAAAETFLAPEEIISGIVVPTEANLVTTHQVFEQIAAANGCQLINDKGEVLILEPACQQALDFYFNLINQFSPTGVQTDISARNAYLNGRTSMIITSPSILPQLAGLDDDARPACPECEQPNYLAQNSGVITYLTGSGSLAVPANFGQMTNLGIINGADRETAVTFAHYWFNQGYPTWLAVEPERKTPMRWGTTDQPRQFIDTWATLPLSDNGLTLSDIYDPSLTNQLTNNIANSNRWALQQGQGSLMTALYEEMVLPIVLQEMLSGYFNSNQTLTEMYLRITDLIPNYEYYLENGD